MVVNTTNKNVFICLWLWFLLWLLSLLLLLQFLLPTRFTVFTLVGMFSNILLLVIRGNISWGARKLFAVGSRTVSVLWLNGGSSGQKTTNDFDKVQLNRKGTRRRKKLSHLAEKHSYNFWLTGGWWMVGDWRWLWFQESHSCLVLLFFPIRPLYELLTGRLPHWLYYDVSADLPV